MTEVLNQMFFAPIAGESWELLFAMVAWFAVGWYSAVATAKCRKDPKCPGEDCLPKE